MKSPVPMQPKPKESPVPMQPKPKVALTPSIAAKIRAKVNNKVSPK
jgi:hypothetical protein